MKLVNYSIEVIEANCTGCYLCEHICPTGAIVMMGPKSSALAVVDNNRCIACFRCVDVCEDDAMLAPERPEPMIVGTDPEAVDAEAIETLCEKAGLDPESTACLCSGTSVKEIAAAVLTGAHDFESAALATGSKSGCLMYCHGPMHRLLIAHVGKLQPKGKNRWYPSSQGLLDVPEDVARRHPEFFIHEEQIAMRQLNAEEKAAKVAALEQTIDLEEKPC